MDAARTLERGMFDAVLIADQPSIDDTYTGSIAPALRAGNDSLCGDPLVPLAMMGAVTKHIGLVPTLTTTFHPPYLLARQLNAMDHMTNGRAGWNVVTSTRLTDGHNFGIDLPDKDLRYDMADEFVELCHKLWNSWEPDAIEMDIGGGQFANPEKVSAINFEGKWFRSRGPLTMPRSPQGSPVIFQAGGSGRGRQFAAKNADCILSNQNSIAGMKEYVDDVTARSKEFDRPVPRVLFSIQPIVGDTQEAAEEKRRAYERLADHEAYLTSGLVFASMSLGVDMAQFDLDTPLADQLHKLDGKKPGESLLFQYFKARPDVTPRDIGRNEALKTTLPMCGTPEQIARQMQEVAEETGAAGFMIREAFLPSYLSDIVDRVVPELQAIGAMRTAYAGKTFRENILEF